jgi:hypothetical protein
MPTAAISRHESLIWRVNVAEDSNEKGRVWVSSCSCEHQTGCVLLTCDCFYSVYVLKGLFLGRTVETAFELSTPLLASSWSAVIMSDTEAKVAVDPVEGWWPRVARPN